MREILEIPCYRSCLDSLSYRLHAMIMTNDEFLARCSLRSDKALFSMHSFWDEDANCLRGVSLNRLNLPSQRIHANSWFTREECFGGTFYVVHTTIIVLGLKMYRCTVQSIFWVLQLVIKSPPRSLGIEHHKWLIEHVIRSIARVTLLNDKWEETEYLPSMVTDQIINEKI